MKRDSVWTWICIMLCGQAGVWGLLLLAAQNPPQVTALAKVPGTPMDTTDPMQQIIVGAFGLLSLGITSWVALAQKRLELTSKKIDAAVNNRHHYVMDSEGNPVSDVNGAPVKLNLVDMTMDTHGSVLEMRQELQHVHKLADKNQAGILEIKEEQKRVNIELIATKQQNCPFHEENTATLGEIKKRLGMDT